RTVSLLVPFSATGTLHRWTTPERVEVLEHTESGVRVRARVSRDELQRLRAAGVEISASGASPAGPR
ncbi:hypothetical protein ACFLTM_05815, partial [Candidatus Bipolaricaulota bacterium]